MIEHRRTVAVAGLLAALSLVATAACGDDDDRGNSGGSSGAVVITGSSTVEPISSAVAEAFAADTPGFAPDVSGPGTGDGFQRLCAGEADIAGASRAIREAERQQCEDAGIEVVELRVGDDGITVATSPANDAVECLTFADLYALTGPESEGFDRWSDANDLAAEVGGTGGFPDAPLDVTGPGEESGTYDFYVEEVIAPIAEARGLPEEEWATRLDYTASPNDSVIVEGIEGSDTSLGWLGFAYYQEEQSAMKAIELDAGDGCVAPSPGTISDGSYPLSRPLFIYVNVARAAENATLSGFVDFYLSDEGLAKVTEVGYVAAPAEAIEEARSAWEAATA